MPRTAERRLLVAYLDGLLARGETIVLRAHRHILFLLLRIMLYVAGAMLMWFLAYAAWRWIPRIGGWVMLVLLLLSIVPLLIAGYRFYSWKVEEFAVTSYRIIQVDGIFTKQTFDSALEMVNDVVMRQTVFGRLFGYGDIEIITGSDIGVNSIRGIADPFAFKRALIDAKMQGNRRAVTEYRNDQRDPDDPRIGRSLQLLDSLQDLRDSGMITTEEYEVRRRQVLER
jgi:uncharacterized membrane protein YdbT with pleckstrin-like domain